MIRVQDQLTFDLPVETVWEFINDKETMAKCIPTLKSYKIVDDDHVEGIVKIQLGILPVESRVSLEVVQRDAPVRVIGKGISYLGESISSLVKEVRPGAVNKDSVGIFTVQVDLNRDGPDKTTVVASIEVDAEGKLKRIYDSIMEKKLPTLRADFIEKVQAAIVERACASPGSSQAEASCSQPASAKTELASRTDEISYSFFGRIVNFFVRLLDRILQRGEQMSRP